jgi:hypothetical protein
VTGKILSALPAETTLKPDCRRRFGNSLSGRASNLIGHT